MIDAYIEFANYPVCPHCEHEDENTYPYMDEVSGGNGTYTCENCKKEFFVNLNIEVTFSVFKPENDECEDE